MGRWHFVLLFFCFTAFRMVFRVYRQIWRVGAVQSFAREMAADLAATAACALIYVLMGGVPALSSLFLGFGCTVASLAFRIAYVCLYRIAKKSGK